MPAWFVAVCTVRIRLKYFGLMALLLLSACGGGGGGNSVASSSASSTTPQIVATPASITRTVAVNAVASQTATITFEFLNMPASAVNFAATRLATGALQDAAWGSVTATGGTVIVWFDAPASLPPGTYTDRIRVFACLDMACTSAAGVETIVPIQYTVTAAVPAPQIALSQNAITVGALKQETVAKTVQINFTAQNFNQAPYVALSYSGSAITSAVAVANGSANGSLFVTLAAPSSLGSGHYVPTLTVNACLDSTCANPVQGYPLSISVSYDIGDAISMTGANGYVLRAVALQTKAMVWSNANNSMYVVLPGDVQASGYVAVLDASTGQLINKTALLVAPTGALAVSNNGAYLYVGLADGTVSRLSTAGFTPSLSIPMGVLQENSTGTMLSHQQYAMRIAVSNNNAQTIAVLTALAPDLKDAGAMRLSVFDGAVQRPNIPAWYTAQGVGTDAGFIVWSPGDAYIYATKNNLAQPGILGFSIDGGGVASVTPYSGDWVLGRPVYSGGLIYTDQGNVFDPASGMFGVKIKPFTYDSFNLVADSNLNKAFVIGQVFETSRSYFVVRSLRLSDRQVLANIDLPDPVITPFNMFTLIRWGTSGLAYTTPSYVVLISGGFVQN